MADRLIRDSKMKKGPLNDWATPLNIGEVHKGDPVGAPDYGPGVSKGGKDPLGIIPSESIRGPKQRHD